MLCKFLKMMHLVMRLCSWSSALRFEVLIAVMGAPSLLEMVSAGVLATALGAPLGAVLTALLWKLVAVVRGGQNATPG